ncbi:hypothetical protein OH77DRAFT_1016784 [Trametes cingulata]|nr:hypothetical protein OH77DRAFT_1016784 [Trametes cingulata]
MFAAPQKRPRRGDITAELGLLLRLSDHLATLNSHGSRLFISATCTLAVPHYSAGLLSQPSIHHRNVYDEFIAGSERESTSLSSDHDDSAVREAMEDTMLRNGSQGGAREPSRGREKRTPASCIGCRGILKPRVWRNRSKSFAWSSSAAFFVVLSSPMWSIHGLPKPAWLTMSLR